MKITAGAGFLRLLVESVVALTLGGATAAWAEPSEDLVGPFPTQTVSGNETAESVRFYEILLRQTWGVSPEVFETASNRSL